MFGPDAFGRVVLADEAEERDRAEQQRDRGEPQREPGPAGEVGGQHEEDHVQEAVHDTDDLREVGPEGLERGARCQEVLERDPDADQHDQEDADDVRHHAIAQQGSPHDSRRYPRGDSESEPASAAGARLCS